MWSKELWWGIRYGPLGWHARMYRLRWRKFYYERRFQSNPEYYTDKLADVWEDGFEHVQTRHEWR